MSYNRENFQKWVDALRSGAYKQGFGRLYTAENDTYCCLGVACDLAERAGVDTNYRDRDWVDRPPGFTGVPWRQAFTLPEGVAKWLGLDWESNDPNPGKEPPRTSSNRGNPRIVKFDGGWRTASEVNDSGNASFAAIADLIEKRWLSDDTE